MDALGYSLRASQKAVIHVVALFVKGATIPCKVRLVANRFLTRCTHQYNVVGVLIHNRDEEKEHAAMVLEWIRRQDNRFDKELKDYLFTEKAIAHT